MTVKEVHTVEEYKNTMKAFNQLDLTPDRISISGFWEFQHTTGEIDEWNIDLWRAEIKKVGYKWFTVKVDGEFKKCRPIETPKWSSRNDDGEIVFYY